MRRWAVLSTALVLSGWIAGCVDEQPDESCANDADCAATEQCTPSGLCEPLPEPEPEPEPICLDDVGYVGLPSIHIHNNPRTERLDPCEVLSEGVEGTVTFHFWATDSVVLELRTETLFLSLDTFGQSKIFEQPFFLPRGLNVFFRMVCEPEGPGVLYELLDRTDNSVVWAACTDWSNDQPCEGDNWSITPTDGPVCNTESARRNSECGPIQRHPVDIDVGESDARALYPGESEESDNLDGYPYTREVGEAHTGSEGCDSTMNAVLFRRF